MKTILFPYHLENNVYCDLIVRALEKEGIEVKKLSYALKNPNYFFSTEVINLSFFENIPNNISKTQAYTVYLAKRVFLFCCKLFKIKIIYTMHNKKQHDGKYNDLNRKIMTMLINKSDAIVSLCSEGKEILLKQYGKDINNKIYIIPHPNYCAIINIISDAEMERIRKKVRAEGKMLCTFLGAISPYKNVELIVQAANELKNQNIQFLIAGNSKDIKYIEHLKNMCSADNVIWDVRFVPEEVADAYIQSSDLILLPYNKSSSLNSGSVFLTMSLGKTCVIPDIGSIKDLNNREDVYIYDYNSDTEMAHYNAFIEAMKRAIIDYNADKDAFQSKGKRLYQEMLELHSLDFIGKRYSDIYQELQRK